MGNILPLSLMKGNIGNVCEQTVRYSRKRLGTTETLTAP